MQNFEVNWEFFGVDGYHTADVRLDGRFARSRSAKGRNWKSSAAGVLVTQASERPFMFSRLELTGALYVPHIPKYPQID